MRMVDGACLAPQTGEKAIGMPSPQSGQTPAIPAPPSLRTDRLTTTLTARHPRLTLG